MTLIIQSQFFLKTTPPKSLGEHFLGANKSLSYHAGLWRQSPPLPAYPIPLQPNQVVVWGWQDTKKQQQRPEEGVLGCILKQRHQRGAFIAKSSFTQTVPRQEGAAHLHSHTFLHLKTSLLYFKGKIKDPPNPFQKNPIIIITIIKNPTGNHEEALRV